MSAIPFMGNSLIALLLIKSCPDAFLGFRRRINSLKLFNSFSKTFRDEKSSIGGDIWKSECKYSVISAAIMEEYGLKTLVR